MSRGIFVGRFQPFHLGHIATIKFALEKVEELVIVIGSAQISHEMRNPFTAGERIQMIKDSLDAELEIDIKRILMIPVPDVSFHPLWTYQLTLWFLNISRCFQMISLHVCCIKKGELRSSNLVFIDGTNYLVPKLGPGWYAEEIGKT